MLLTSSLKTKAIQSTIQMNDLHHAEILKYYRRIIKILLTGRNKKIMATQKQHTHLLKASLLYRHRRRQQQHIACHLLRIQ